MKKHIVPIIFGCLFLAGFAVLTTAIVFDFQSEQANKKYYAETTTNLVANIHQEITTPLDRIYNVNVNATRSTIYVRFHQVYPYKEGYTFYVTPYEAIETLNSGTIVESTIPRDPSGYIRLLYDDNNSLTSIHYKDPDNPGEILLEVEK